MFTFLLIIYEYTHFPKHRRRWVFFVQVTKHFCVFKLVQLQFFFFFYEGHCPFSVCVHARACITCMSWDFFGR